MLTRTDIDHLAALARIAVPDEEKDRLVKDLGGVLDYISELNELDIEITAEDRAGALRNVMRDDAEPNPGGTYTPAILENAPDKKDGYVKVRQIFQ